MRERSGTGALLALALGVAEDSLGVLDENMLLVHSGWLEPHEVALLAKRKPTLVCSPSSSMRNRAQPRRLVRLQ